MNTRGRIINAADDLYKVSSFREVSIDSIAATAGVTKKTFYYHFRSKDDLLVAFLEAKEQPTLERYQAWAGKNGMPSEKITRIFETLAAEASEQSWVGCGFIRAVMELAKFPGHPALQVAQRHRERFEAWFKTELDAAGYQDSEILSKAIVMLLDGAIIRLIANKDRSYPLSAAITAQRLLLRNLIA
ncbi:MAG: TetR/AcrR family transcriptional regulator [Planctomycetota bacterium]